MFPKHSVRTRHPQRDREIWRRTIPLPLFLTCLSALLAGAIIISSVVQRQVNLDDGTVWVISSKHRKAARLNVRLRQADAALPLTSARHEVAQWNADTMLTDGMGVAAVSAATLERGEDMELPKSSEIQTAGGTTAILDTQSGELWATAARGTPPNPAKDEPLAELGHGGRFTVDHDGSIWTFRPSDGMVSRTQRSRTGFGGSEQIASLCDERACKADSFTVVDGTPVIATGATIRFEGRQVRVPDVNRILLQSPPSDGKQREWLAAASRKGLHILTLEGDTPPVHLSSGEDGEPARPVSSLGCVYSAWSSSESNYLRICSSEVRDAEFETLDSIKPTSQLMFRSNHRQVILNDLPDGDVWDPDNSTQPIRMNWDTMPVEHDAEQSQADQSDRERESLQRCSEQPGRITAKDDRFGWRPGASGTLDLLRNDEQTDCSVLRIERVGAVEGGDATVTISPDGRHVRLDGSRFVEGTLRFSYGISDGQGQTSGAEVRVSVASDNHPPVHEFLPNHLEVEQGASLTVNALGWFRDPESDPMMLISAKALDSEQVSVFTRADGKTVFDSGSMQSGRVTLELTVSDGQATATGTTQVLVRPAGSLPAELDPVSVDAVAGQNRVIDLTDHLHATGSSPLRLTGVDPPDEATVTMGEKDLSIRFRADNPGTYHVPYTISQGSSSSSGRIRVEVRQDKALEAPPNVVDDVALLDESGNAMVEPLSNDADPSGGLLALAKTDADPPNGLEVGMTDHRRLHIVARQMPRTPQVIPYTAVNKHGATRGTITVYPATGTSENGPKAHDIEAQVRAGGIVSIGVLDHVDSPDAASLTLDDTLSKQNDTYGGLAFVSLDKVRYQAPLTAGEQRLAYTVRDGRGNADSAMIIIRVHQADADSKPAPEPRPVEARVPSGRQVRIPIDLTGVDPDGDDLQLLGLGNQVPQLGRVTQTGPDYLLYEAYPDATGTDTFSYAVEDWTGQRAQGDVRVALFQVQQSAGLLARDDDITLRPGTMATVPVLNNDLSDSVLSLEPRLESSGIADARPQEDGSVRFTAPEQTGVFHITYAARDEAGLRDTATLSVSVSPDAPLSAPVAYDYRVPSAATIDRKSVDVDVSPWISNPSGDIADLTVAVHESASRHARRKGGRQSTIFTIDLMPNARAVPYVVTNARHGSTSMAFIHVPAYGVFPPMLRPKAPRLEVAAGETIEFSVADHVRVGAGKEPLIADSSSVSATKAADGQLVVDERTLRFPAPHDYSGPASITFTVVDGVRGGDAAHDREGSRNRSIVNSAVLTIPITVTGGRKPAPVLSSLSVEAGAGDDPITVDLKALTFWGNNGFQESRRPSESCPSPECAYSGGIRFRGVKAIVSSEGLLRIQVDHQTKPGVSVPVPVALTHASGRSDATITVHVVVSAKPLAKLADATVQVKAGTGTTVDVLENAYNPFPHEALRLVSCETSDDKKLKVTCESSGETRIEAAPDIGASTYRVTTRVEDATATMERSVTGVLSVTVTDRPSAPLLSAVTGPVRDGAVDLSWTPGSSNGSTVLEYEVSYGLASTATRSCGTATLCHVDGLVNGRTYSFQVRARNEVGWSDWSNTVKATPDKVPPAPESVQATGAHLSVTVSWTMPRFDGSPVTHFTVTLDGLPGETTVDADARSCTFTFEDALIHDGSSTGATVTAHNAAGSSSGVTSAHRARPFGTPKYPTVSARQTATPSDQVEVSARLGDMANTTCVSATLRLDDDMRMVSCDDLTASFPISSEDYYSPLIPSVTIRTRESGTMTAKGESITPVHTPDPPLSVSLQPQGGQCVLRWNANGGLHDGYVVTISGVERRTDRTSLTYPLAAWGTCGSASVRQTLKGNAGPAVTVSSDVVGNKAPAIVRNVSLQWQGHDGITVFHDLRTHGQPASATLTIHADDVEVVSHTFEVGMPSSFVIDMADVDGEGRFEWSLLLNHGDPSLVAGVQANGSIINPDGGGRRPDPVRMRSAGLAEARPGTVIRVSAMTGIISGRRGWRGQPPRPQSEPQFNHRRRINEHRHRCERHIRHDHHSGCNHHFRRNHHYGQNGGFGCDGGFLRICRHGSCCTSRRPETKDLPRGFRHVGGEYRQGFARQA